ncbi:hypothetical protein ACFQ0Q_24115 [Streptomyces aureus]
MEPQRSLRKGLSRRGRLENAWASALADADPRAGLVSLRAVLAGIEEYQDRTADLWPSFQRSFLGPRFLPLVETADLDRLAQVGERMAAEGRIGLHQSWVPLADAAVARSDAGDRDFAVSLYTRLYRSAFVHEESRSIAATALARIGADQDDQLAIYVDIFRRYATVPPEVHQAVGRLLGAGFADETGRVERAFAFATQLSAAGLRLAGLDRTLGLGALLLHRETADAADHFTRACSADPTDGEALRGLIAARLHSGAYAEALTAVRGREAALTPRGAELTDLCRMLEWLELEPGRDGPPGPATPAPLTAVRLATIGDGGDSRPWGRYAQGRAQLLEGNADLAAKNLVVVADAFPDRSDLGYHAAWAQLLCGEHEAAGRRCRALLADGDARAWPLGCLLADADPGHRATDGERTVMKGAAHAFTAVVTARLRLAEGQEPGVDLAWDPLGAEGATVPELLEALRTLLGVEVAGGRRNAVGHLTALSLFGRLPLPEQLLWRALSALPEDRDRAHSLLEQARGQGLDRATLVLAVTELNAGHPDRAADLLDGIRGPKAELVRARAELALGRTADAGRRLDRLPTPRARYESGVLALREAAALWAGGEADRAVQRAGWAAARLIDAQVTGPGALPPVPADAGRLARAARLLAERAARPADGTGAAPWRIVRHHPRTAWLLGLGQLLVEPRGAEPVLVEALVGWAGRPMGRPPPMWATPVPWRCSPGLWGGPACWAKNPLYGASWPRRSVFSRRHGRCRRWRAKPVVPPRWPGRTTKGPRTRMPMRMPRPRSGTTRCWPCPSRRPRSRPVTGRMRYGCCGLRATYRTGARRAGRAMYRTGARKARRGTCRMRARRAPTAQAAPKRPVAPPRRSSPSSPGPSKASRPPSCRPSAATPPSPPRSSSSRRPVTSRPSARRRPRRSPWPCAITT